MASAAHAFSPVSHRLLFAIRPPAVVCERIHEERGLLDIQGRPVRKDRFHITLLISEDYEEYPDDLAALAVEAASEIVARSFRTALDSISLNGQRAVLVPSERPAALIEFREKLGFALRRAGFDLRADYRFSPHLTLGYNVHDHRIEQIDAISWTVEDFVLIHSLVGLTQHVELGRWRLRA